MRWVRRILAITQGFQSRWLGMAPMYLGLLDWDKADFSLLLQWLCLYSIMYEVRSITEPHVLVWPRAKYFARLNSILHTRAPGPFAFVIPIVSGLSRLNIRTCALHRNAQGSQRDGSCDQPDNKSLFSVSLLSVFHRLVSATFFEILP
jgi:hypothetical protein